MKKNRRLYGILNPNAIDYMLAVVSGLFAVSALFIGIFVSATKAFGFSNQAWQTFLNIFKFDIGEGNWIVIIGSISIYLSALVAIILTCASLFKKIYRPIISAITIFFSGIVNALLIAFFSTFINPVVTGVHGIFPVMLLVLVLAILFFTRLSFELSLNKLFGEEEEEYEEEYIPTQLEPEQEEEEVYEPEQEEVVEEEPQQPEEEEVEFNPENEVIKEEVHEIESSDGKSLSINSKKLTFDQKLRRATKETRVIYKEIRDYFEEIGFKLKIAKAGAIFYHKQTKYAVITVSGKNGLKVYYKLDIANYKDSPIPLIDVQNVRKYEKTPVYLKVKSDLSVKRAKHLMDDVKAGLDND